MDSVFSLVNGDDGAVLDIFGEIGFAFWGDGVDAKSVREQTKGIAKGSTLRVNIDSPGGSVSDAIAVFNILRETGAVIDVHVQGIAASAASYLAMVAEEGHLHMPTNTLMMIHKPWLYTAGNSDELRRDADALDKFQAAIETGYMRHWTGDAEELQAAISQDSWYTAAEAAELFGVVVEGEPFEAAAKIDLSKLDQEKLPVAALQFGSPAAGAPDNGPGDVNAEGGQGMLAKVDALLDRIENLREERDEAQRAKDKLAADLTDARAQASDMRRQIDGANDRAQEAIETLERVTGQAHFGGDSEQNGQISWAEAQKRCGDYAEARKQYPEAYEAFRQECRKQRT